MSSDQPLVVYPDNATKQAPSHLNGSFGAVFIVLAVIVVLSATACFLSRLCSRRLHKQQQHHPKAHSPRPKEKPNKAPRDREGDIEFGFGKGANPAAKQDANNIGGVSGGNGMRFAGEWEGKAGQYRPV
ncbi:SNF2 domain-containing protein [Actinidia chinensis var. chinensis]|uniref:SNF2 domain-containing protein n=1 Tax=Actinidia chinensis var. chinensis TaxID=1590841 RepID=A0A2R6RS10_ACTCC|nr:SNF2 domain-containing protein [Actinidia chinensis var. chinensis]